MYSGLEKLFECRTYYCELLILYNKCKWYEFMKKREIKEQMDFIYPLLVNEIKLLN